MLCLDYGNKLSVEYEKVEVSDQHTMETVEQNPAVLDEQANKQDEPTPVVNPEPVQAEPISNTGNQIMDLAASLIGNMNAPENSAKKVNPVSTVESKTVPDLKPKKKLTDKNGMPYDERWHVWDTAKNQPDLNRDGYLKMKRGNKEDGYEAELAKLKAAAAPAPEVNQNANNPGNVNPSEQNVITECSEPLGDLLVFTCTTLLASHLGDEWYPKEGEYKMLSKAATRCVDQMGGIQVDPWTSLAITSLAFAAPRMIRPKPKTKAALDGLRSWFSRLLEKWGLKQPVVRNLPPQVKPKSRQEAEAMTA